MADDRAQRSVGPILATWMDAAAPERAPARLLEESFARTMAVGQARVYPWHTLKRSARGWSAGRRMMAMSLTAVAVVLAVALTTSLVLRPSLHVGGESSPSPSDESSPSPSPSGSPTPVPFPSAIPIEPTAQIPVTGPVTIASDGTSVWLLTNAGELVRLDPLTNTVAASVKLTRPADAFQSLDGDMTALWVTDWDTSKLLRFDPKTLKATGSIDVGAQPKGVLVGSTAVWTADTRGGSVTRIDPKTGTVVRTIPVGPAGPSGPNWLAEGFGSIWVGVPNVAAVIRINEATNAVEATIPIVGPASPCGGMAAGSTAIWITSCDGSNLISQIDPLTNTVAATIDLRGRAYTFAMIADRPWTSPTDGQIVRIDPVGHDVDRVVAPSIAFSGGGDVVVAAGSLWIIDWASNRVLRLPIAAFDG